MNHQTKKIIQLLRNETIASREAFTPDQMAVLENMIDRLEEAMAKETGLIAGSISYPSF